MAAPTYAELLEAAKLALQTLLEGGAAAYAINGRSYTAHNLGELRKLIQDLEARVARSSGPGIFRLGGF